jgi:predicted transposase YdaD
MEDQTSDQSPDSTDSSVPPGTPTPHNNLFQFGLADPKSAGALIRQMLPSNVVQQMDLSTLKKLPNSYVDDLLKNSQSDVVYSVMVRSDANDLDGESTEEWIESLIYFLIEHKSKPERLTAFQLLKYLVRIWEDGLRNGESLRPIIPLVVYHGKTAWMKNRTLSEIIRYPAELVDYSVKFAFPILDLWQTNNDKLDEEPNLFLQSLLYLLKYGRSEELPEHLLKIFAAMISAQDSDLSQRRIYTALIYLMNTNPSIKSEDLQQAISQVFPTFAYPGSIADTLRKEGREEGREEGMENGLLIGKIQLLEELCGQPISATEALASLTHSQLSDNLSELQARLRDRQ